MISLQDVSYITRLSAVAQLLELLGQQETPSVRSSDVFQTMANDVWEVYLYMMTRLTDELHGVDTDTKSAEYFQQIEQRIRKQLD